MTWYAAKEYCEAHKVSKTTLYRWLREGKVIADGPPGQRIYRTAPPEPGLPAAKEKSFLDLLEDGGRNLIERASRTITKASDRLEEQLDDANQTFTVNDLTRIIRSYGTIFERAVGGQICVAKDAPPETENIFDPVDGEVN